MAALASLQADSIIEGLKARRSKGTKSAGDFYHIARALPKPYACFASGLVSVITDLAGPFIRRHVMQSDADGTARREKLFYL